MQRRAPRHPPYRGPGDTEHLLGTAVWTSPEHYTSSGEEIIMIIVDLEKNVMHNATLLRKIV